MKPIRWILLKDIFKTTAASYYTRKGMCLTSIAPSAYFKEEPYTHIIVMLLDIALSTTANLVSIPDFCTCPIV